MKHIVFLIYLIAGTAGLLNLIFYLYHYRKHKTPLFTAYIRFHSAYSFLMLVSTIMVYVAVNIYSSTLFYIIFSGLVLVCLGFVSITLPAYNYLFAEIPLPDLKKNIFRVLSALVFLSGAATFVLIHTNLFFIPTITGLICFAAILLENTLTISRKIKTLPAQKRRHLSWDNMFFIGAVIFAAIEIWIKFHFRLLENFVINIALIYLAWNIMTIVTINDYFFPSESYSEKNLLEKNTRFALTPREKEVALMIMQGYSNKEIAYELKIAFNTVKNHIYNVYQKTGVKTRVELLNLFRNS